MTSVHDYLPGLRKYALYLTRNADRADDLVQDTMLAALRGGVKFEHPGAQGYLKQRMKWESLRGGEYSAPGSARQNGKKQPRPSTVEVEEHHVTSGPSQEYACLVREFCELAEHSGQARAAFLAGLGYTGREIGEMLGIAERTVKWRTHNARETLRERFDLP